MAMSNDSKNVSRLCSLLSFGPSRGKRNDFLIQSPWDEEQALKHQAMHQLGKLYRPNEPLFLIIDDSKKAKRGKHVEAVLEVFDLSAKQFITGHPFVTATLYYRGITIPFAIRLYLNRKGAKALKKSFKKLTTLAVEIIEDLQLPEDFKAEIYTLVDSYYFNQPVLKAAKAKNFFVIGATKKNRNLLIRGRKSKLGVYMHNLFKRETQKTATVQTQKGKRRYHYVSNTYTVSKIPDPVKIVFSKRGNQKKILGIACTDLRLPASLIILYYTFRWTIEVWFKQAKQHLGLGALHRIRWEGVVKHLHLSACAFGLLTHLALASEKEKSKILHAASSVLPARSELRDLFFEDAIDYFIDEELHQKPSGDMVRLKKFLCQNECKTTA
jgi:SRSO17 transposase